jgi:threonine synthase
MVSGENSELVSDYMQKLKENGKYTVSDEIRGKITDCFYGGCADDDVCADTIKETYEKYGYVTDTHTAVAVGVHNKYVEETLDNTKTIIASTASPFKFNGAVLCALDEKNESIELDEFRLLEKLAKDYELRVPSSLASLEEKEIRFEVVCDKNQMKAVINEFLN